MRLAINPDYAKDLTFLDSVPKRRCRQGNSRKETAALAAASPTWPPIQVQGNCVKFFSAKTDYVNSCQTNALGFTEKPIRRPVLVQPDLSTQLGIVRASDSRYKKPRARESRSFC